MWAGGFSFSDRRAFDVRQSRIDIAHGEGGTSLQAC
jgi:hypothetical protein